MELDRQDRSHAWLGRKIGMTKYALSHRMTGQVEFTVSELQSIAQALEVPVEQLLGASA